MLKNIRIALIICISIISLAGCKKYLSEKPDKKLAVPETLQDLQALLDYYTRVSNADPSSTVQSVDDFYITDTDYDGLFDDSYREFYKWGTTGIFDGYPNDWSYQYDKVNIANIVLENIDKIERNKFNEHEWDNIKGQALLLRAISFQWVAWIWAEAYEKNTEGKLGIPLRLKPDFNIPSVRAGLQETYDKILLDYKESIKLLPVNSIHIFRPSKAASYGLIARTYLSMGDFEMAGLYSDSCLALYSNLLDFNTLNPAANYPIARFNEEIIMENRMINLPFMLSGTRGKIDTLLYASYAEDDLRKIVYFKTGAGFHTFKGSYEGGTALFSGIAVSEVMLMKAESMARNGSYVEAIDVLNSLLIKRWKINKFVPLSATDVNNALDKILMERRKELVMRGLRWMDVKRLNKLKANIIMRRTIKGQVYSILPNDKRYAFPIPETIIKLSGIEQNPR